MTPCTVVVYVCVKHGVKGRAATLVMASHDIFSHSKPSGPHSPGSADSAQRAQSPDAAHSRSRSLPRGAAGARAVVCRALQAACELWTSPRASAHWTGVRIKLGHTPHTYQELANTLRTDLSRVSKGHAPHPLARATQQAEPCALHHGLMHGLTYKDEGRKGLVQSFGISSGSFWWTAIIVTMARPEQLTSSARHPRQINRRTP